mmetsp:Transcript_14461/g.37262  ORF Transcript_14461/g.37262 Transcript_14461/m.37262 type:complete len:589 (-) Transcript_14461:108-1874(-)
MLVRRLGHDGLGRRSLHSLSEGDDWVGHPDWGASHEVLLKILQANLEVKLSGSGDDMLTSVLDGALDHRVGLGESLESLNQLWQVRGDLTLDGDTHDRGHGELHGLDWVGVGVLLSGQSGVLGDELIQSNHGDGVSARHILDGILSPSHAQHGSLDGLDVQVLLGAWDVVWSHDSDLLSGSNSSGEDTTEGEETALIRGWNHLGDVEHEWAIWVTVGDGGSVHIIRRSLVEGLDSVGLGGGWGWEVVDHHLQKRAVGWKPGLHDSLHERLSVELLVVVLEEAQDSEGLHLLEDLLLLALHAPVDDRLDRVEDELDERALARLRPSVLLSPLLSLWIEEVVSPELGHHLLLRDAELLGVELGEGGQGEGPSVESSGERDGTLVRVDLALSQLLVSVGGHDDVGVLDDAEEVGVGLLSLEHELQEAPIHLVDGEDGADPLSEGLSQHGLGLDAHALDTVHDDERSVGDTEGGGDLGREVDVPRGVDQVDEEIAPVSLSLESGEPLLFHLVVQGNSGGLDRDATLLLVGSGVGQALVSGVLDGDDTGGGDEGVGEGGLSVVDVRNNTHVSDVMLLVHERTDLVNSELHHLD